MRRGEEAAEAENHGEPVSDEDSAFAEFYREVSQAEGQAEADALAAVREADKGWQARMTYLERRFATRWRQQSGVRHVKDEAKTETLEDIIARGDRERGAA
jgi:hypothetical protein